MQINELSDKLTSHGVKPSLQRLNILNFLLDNNIHPTVDTIYNELIGEIPTLSKTTVYNTLKLFVDKGVVQQISIEENELRYDGCTDFHGHFKCVQCGKIYDFNVSESKIPSIVLNDFQIIEKHLYYKGICINCLNKK